MKKMIILTVIIFFLTGCYDNVELTDMDIITGLGIDYVDDHFLVTYEILNSNVTNESEILTSYTIDGIGNTISASFIDAGYKTDKLPYLAHLKTVIISENISVNHLNEITDYLIRENFRESFFLIVSKNNSPKEILASTSKDIPVMSIYIANLIENEKYNNNLAIKDTYEKIYAKLASNKTDIILNTITLVNDKVSLDNSIIFKGYNEQNTLSKLNSTLYNLLTTDVNAMLFSKEYQNGFINISISNSNTSINVDKDTINISLSLEGKIVENNANFNLKDENTYQRLNSDFSHLIEEDITNFIYILQKNKTDILGFSEKYYQKMRKENNDLWQTSEVVVNVSLKINTKGYIFEVDYDK